MVYLIEKSFLSKKIHFTKEFSLSIEIICLIFILIFALFLRISFLENPSFWVDESISSLASLKILEKGIPVFDSGVLYSRALVFHYSQALSFIIFGVNDFAARFPSVIFGVLSVFLAFLVGREYNKNAGLIFALFVATFFLEVFFSRQARFYQLFQLAFFASIYLLYKSKKDLRYLFLGFVCLVIAVDTQPAGLVLIPFFIIHILLFNKKNWYYSFVALLVFFLERASLFSVLFSSKIPEVVDGSKDVFFNYFSTYLSFTSNVFYLIIMFLIGSVWAFFKNKTLTLLILIPSLIVLSGVIYLEVFALRYAYFFVFVILLFSSLLISFLVEKYGKEMWVLVLILVILPSNLIFPFSYGTMLIPSTSNLNDFSAPEINFKDINSSLFYELKSVDSFLLTHYSPHVEWYLQKPLMVLDFSMTGKRDYSISREVDSKLVDVYSGASIITSETQVPSKFYYIEQGFAFSKLNPSQKELVESIKQNCSLIHNNNSVKIFSCALD